jgi:hypothetical protein
MHTVRLSCSSLQLSSMVQDWATCLMCGTHAFVHCRMPPQCRLGLGTWAILHAPVRAAAYSDRPMARGAVLPWPGLTTAAAYTVITSRKVMKTCTAHQHDCDHVRHSALVLCVTSQALEALAHTPLPAASWQLLLLLPGRLSSPLSCQHQRRCFGGSLAWLPAQSLQLPPCHRTGE